MKEQMVRSMERTGSDNFERTIAKPENTVAKDGAFTCRQCSETFLNKREFAFHLDRHIRDLRRELKVLEKEKEA